MALRNTMFGFIFAAIVFIGLFSFMGDLQTTYDTYQINKNLTSIYGEVNASAESISSTSVEIQENLQNASVTSVSGVDNLFAASYSALRLLFKVPQMIDGLFQVAAVSLNLPRYSFWLFGLFGAVIILYIAFEVISAILRKDI